MSTSQILDLALWCAHPVLQSVVVVAIWRRKLQKQFPAFFSYLICQIVFFALIFPFRSHYTWFFWVYWVGAAVNVVMSFMIIHEIFVDVFRPYHTLKDLGTVIFKWAGVVMLLVSIVVAFSNSADRGWLMHALLTLQRSVRLVQFGLVLFLLLFARFLGVSKRQFSFGIALGFGFMAGVELLLLAIVAGGYMDNRGFNSVNMVVYNISLLGWIGYAVFSVGARLAAMNPLQTQRWEQGLVKTHDPMPADSLIPMFESMVERAINRTESLEDPSAADVKYPSKALSAASTGTGTKFRG